jgi:hypothetical protein
MSSKPIIFSTPMVKAILENKKSVTRRVVKPQPDEGDTIEITDNMGYVFDPNYRDEGSTIIKPPYQPGDILYVKETWQPEIEREWLYNYKATDERLSCGRWRSPLFMPRSAARIWLRTVAVRCERLQSITPHDAWLEGCRIGNSFLWEDHIPDLQQMCRDIVFRELWNSINAKPKPVYGMVDGKKRVVSYISYPWEDVQETRTYRGKPWVVCGNPFVWPISFERIEKPMDGV